MRKLVLALLMLLLLGSLGVVIMVRKTHPAGDSSEDVQGKSALELIHRICNEDVKWRGTTLGLLPRLSGASLKLLNTREHIEPLLLNALKDGDRFVAAHVLLTIRSQAEFLEERGKWNGLRVELLVDGEVSYEGNDLAELHGYWEKTLQQQE